MPRGKLAAAREPIAPMAIADAPATAAGGVIEMRPFQTIDLSPLNPRKKIDDAEIASLADSIFAKGVLQNLVCRPAPPVKKSARWPDALEVAAGERRWRAVAKLIADGRVGADYPMPVRVVPMTDIELVEFAMTENLQRRDMLPLEEADGFAWLVEHGEDAATIAVRTGYRLLLIRQRLALHHRLSPEVRQALEAGDINLGQAQAFTVGDKERQADILSAVKSSPIKYDAAEIRRVLVEKYVPLSRAIFSRDLYKGPRRRDLFHDEDFAEDWSEFRRLQAAAAEARRQELAQNWAWAELQQGGQVALWNYDRPIDPSAKEAGAIVHLRDDLRVEIHTGLVKKQPVEPAPKPLRTAGPQPPVDAAKPRPTPAAPPSVEPDLDRLFSKAHLVWAKQEKSRRLQLAVATNSAVAQSLAVLGLLGSQEVRLQVAESWFAPADRIENKELKDRVDQALKRLNGDTTPSEAGQFRRLVAMPGPDRRDLLALLVARCCGTWPGYDPDLGDTQLALAIAEACGIDAGPLPPSIDNFVDGLQRFTLTTAYLERLDKTQLARVAHEAVGGDAFPDAAAGLAMNRDELIDRIATSPDFDPAWSPPELQFGSRPTLLRLVGVTDDRGGVTRKRVAA